MEKTQPGGRSWEWTPSPFMNRFMSTILRLPLLHRMLSNMMLLITFTGRKSGKSYTTPVGYQRNGDTIIILTKRFRTWWRNFEDPAPVSLRLKGRDVEGTARSLTDVESIRPIIKDFLEAMPRQAPAFGVDVVEGKVTEDSLNALAPKVVVIQVELQQ